MFRLVTLACAALALLLGCGPAKAAGAHTAEISCKLRLPKQAIAGDPGYFITIMDIIIGPGDGHRIRHDPVAYYYVVSGTGSLSVDGEADRPLTPGIVTVVAPHTVHQFHNTSEAGSLVVAATYLEASQDQVLTAFVGGPEVKHQGCPHTIK